MSKRPLARGSLLFAVGCILFSFLPGCSMGETAEAAPGFLGAWMQVWSIKTPEAVDGMLDRLEAGRYDAVFANVLAYGFAYYESDLLDKHPDVAPDFDPLAYLIKEARTRGIEVHAWLVSGPLEYKGDPAPTLAAHPEWAMVGPDGRRSHWLNYNRPDVRKFLGDIVLELVTDYEVDGVHFDYLRYPGSEWGYDLASAALAADEYGMDVDLLRYTELPAYATFEGNALAEPTTARVLAVFDNGDPAVLINSYGAGTAIVLNWDASDRQVAASGEILDRSIDYLGNRTGEVYVLSSKASSESKDPEGLIEGMAWLRDLGRLPVETSAADLATLEADGVLVLPEVYRISAQVAEDLADFVRRGGGVILIDGPTPSIGDENLQAITGMRAKGGYFKEPRLLTAVQEHDIVPSAERTLTLDDYAALDAQWVQFRKEGINKLLEELYQRVKQERPDVVVSITISGDQDKLATQHLLDWQSWLDGGHTDLIIPRAYVEEDEPLQPVLAVWQPFIDRTDRIVLGLKVFSRRDDDRVPKTPQRMMEEIELAYGSGSNDLLLFDIDRSSDAQLDALALARSGR